MIWEAPSETAEHDHRRFAEALEDPDSRDDAELEVLLKDLDRHIAIEEFDLFPVAAKHHDEDHWRSNDVLGDPT